MFTIHDLAQPATVEEAYRILVSNQNSAVLGGCTYLRLGTKKIGTAIDLSKLNLAFIKEKDDEIEIGAMTTFRQVETHPVFKKNFNGVLATAISQIMGVQFRNIATVGATVFSKYGFSDLITPLLALDTEVELFKGGRMLLEKFLDQPNERDILTGILVKKNRRKAVYLNFRNSATDYSILNVTVSKLEDDCHVVVGARPLKAKIARNASEVLSKGHLSPENIEKAAGAAAEELSFGTNIRGTAEYRKELCRVLVKRAATEVCKCG